MKTFGVVGWILAVVLGLMLYLHRSTPDNHLMLQALRQDSIITHRQLSQVAALGTKLDTIEDTVSKTVTHWKQAAAAVSDTVHDTTVVNAVAAGNQLAGRCQDLQSQCQQYHDSASSLIIHLRGQYSRLDSLYQRQPKDRPLGLGLFAGFSVDPAKPDRVQKSIGFGLTYKIF